LRPPPGEFLLLPQGLDSDDRRCAGMLRGSRRKSPVLLISLRNFLRQSRGKTAAAGHFH
jgi:hypothetical protein